jgi:hypothetical protein
MRSEPKSMGGPGGPGRSGSNQKKVWAKILRRKNCWRRPGPTRTTRTIRKRQDGSGLGMSKCHYQTLIPLPILLTLNDRPLQGRRRPFCRRGRSGKNSGMTPIGCGEKSREEGDGLPRLVDAPATNQLARTEPRLCFRIIALTFIQILMPK